MIIYHLYSIDLGVIIFRFAHFHLCCGRASPQPGTHTNMHGAIMQVSAAINMLSDRGHCVRISLAMNKVKWHAHVLKISPGFEIGHT